MKQENLTKEIENRKKKFLKEYKYIAITTNYQLINNSYNKANEMYYQQGEIINLVKKYQK